MATKERRSNLTKNSLKISSDVAAANHAARPVQSVVLKWYRYKEISIGKLGNSCLKNLTGKYAKLKMQQIFYIRKQ